MSNPDSTEERVPIEEAVRRLVGTSTDNTSKIQRLEIQIDELCRGFEEYRVQTTNSLKEEVQTLS